MDSDLDHPVSEMNNHSKESIEAVQLSISITKERAATQITQATVDSDLDPPVSEMNNHSKESIEAVQLSISITKERAATLVTQATNDNSNIEPNAGKSFVLALSSSTTEQYQMVRSLTVD